MPGPDALQLRLLEVGDHHTSCRGTIARSGWPIWTTCPSSTLRLDTTRSRADRTRCARESRRRRDRPASRQSRLGPARLRVLMRLVGLTPKGEREGGPQLMTPGAPGRPREIPGAQLRLRLLDLTSVCALGAAPGPGRSSRRSRRPTSATSKSRRADQIALQRLRLRSSSRARLPLRAVARTTSARIASVAERRASSRARDSSTADSADFTPTTPTAARRGALVDLRAGALARQRHLGSRGAKVRLGGATAALACSRLAWKSRGSRAQEVALH